MKSIIATFMTAFSLWRLSKMLIMNDSEIPAAWRIARWAAVAASIAVAARVCVYAITASALDVLSVIQAWPK